LHNTSSISDSRSQQLYLQSHLPSAPSFVDSQFDPYHGSSRRSSIDPYNSRPRIRPRVRRRRRGDVEEGVGVGGDGEGDGDGDGETETGTEDDDESRISDDEYDEEDEDEYYAQVVEDGDVDQEERISRPHSRRNSANSRRRELQSSIIGNLSPSPSPSRSRSAGNGGGGGGGGGDGGGDSSSQSPHRLRTLSKSPFAKPPPSSLYKSTTINEYGSMGKRPVTSSTPFDNPIPFPAKNTQTAQRTDEIISSVPATPTSYIEPLRKRSMVSLSVTPTMSGLRRSGQQGTSGWSRASMSNPDGMRKRRRSSVVSSRSVMMGMELGRSTNGQTVGFLSKSLGRVMRGLFLYADAGCEHSCSTPSRCW
jgi:hypothetical protein